MKSVLQVVMLGLSAMCVCGVAASQAQHEQHQTLQGSNANELHIMNGWVRALPPAQKVTAAYLTLHNASTGVMTIDGFSSPIAESAELHDSVLQDGQMRMLKQDTLVLSPDEHKTLQPAGLHIMLIGLESAPKEGDQVEVCVKSGELQSCKAVPVLKMAPMDAMPHHQHQ
ncbi:MAG: copper chaperone PCu(A)C [Halieaceae bacterium]|nr:copper chaperone PCu(A)C [Halieaceae bacterium]